MKQFTKQAACASGKSAARTAMKQSKYMKKTAEDSATFNETVPQITPNQPQNDYYGNQGNLQPYKNTSVGQAGQQDQYAAVPAGYDEQQQMAPEMPGAPPEMIGAAQSFLGPEVMQAASQGDPSAMDLVARTAAHVGMNFTNMMSNQSMAGQEGADAGQIEGAAAPEMAPQGISTPEEDIVNELVPDIQAQPQMGQQPPSGQPAQGQEVAGQGEETAQKEQGGEADDMPNHIDLKTVAKLINLAKAGKI